MEAVAIEHKAFRLAFCVNTTIYLRRRSAMNLWFCAPLPQFFHWNWGRGSACLDSSTDVWCKNYVNHLTINWEWDSLILNGSLSHVKRLIDIEGQCSAPAENCVDLLEHWTSLRGCNLGSGFDYSGYLGEISCAVEQRGTSLHRGWRVGPWTENKRGVNHPLCYVIVTQ